MLNVLSLQSDVLGNKTYSDSLRHYFSSYEDIRLVSRWYNERRSTGTKIVNKLVRIPLIPTRNNLDMRRARAEWGYGYVTRQLAKRELRKNKYDLLHVHSQVQAFASADLMQRVPTVLTIDMTAYQIAREAAPRYRWTHEPSIRLERRVLEAAAHVVTFSEWARHSVITEHGIPESKVTAILPGTRLESFEPPLYESRDVPRILFVGGDFKRKGGWDLLQVFSEHFSSQAELHLVTNQPLPKLGRNVFLHAGVRAYTPEWHELFRTSDLFALPSYADAIPHVFQEAAGYGLALIGSNVGAISEMVRDGQNGFLVAPGDHQALTRALHLLVIDPSQRLQMRHRSHAIAVAEFSALNNFRKLADLMKRVV